MEIGKYGDFEHHSNFMETLKYHLQMTYAGENLLYPQGQLLL